MMPDLVLFILLISGVAVLIVCLVHLSIWIGNREADNEKKQDEERQHKRDKREADANHSPEYALVARLETIADQLDAQHKQDSRRDRKHTFLEVLGITAAIAAAFFALWLASINSAQLYDTRKTNMVQLRAYISAQIIAVPNSFLADHPYSLKRKVHKRRRNSC